MKMFVWIAVLTAAWPAAVSAAESKLMQGKSGASTPYELQTKHSKTLLYAADDEMARLEAGGSGAQPRMLGYRIFAVSPTELKQKLADTASHNLPVFYASPQRSARSRYIATGNLIVQLEPGISAERFASQQHLTLLRPVDAGAGIFLMAPASPQGLVRESNTLNTLPEVKNASPEWIRPVLLR